ncbi:MAG: hypothetical protein ACTHQE_05855, partial [Thermomicrobiales bacterium]
SLACFWPEAAAELYDFMAAGDYAGLAEYHARVVAPIYAMRQRRPGYEVTVMKTAIAILGYPTGPARAPLANLTDGDIAELTALLKALQVPTKADRTKVLTGVGND